MIELPPNQNSHTVHGLCLCLSSELHVQEFSRRLHLICTSSMFDKFPMIWCAGVDDSSKLSKFLNCEIWLQFWHQQQHSHNGIHPSWGKIFTWYWVWGIMGLKNCYSLMSFTVQTWLLFFLYYNKHHVGAVDGKIIFEFSIKVDR
jgi:hypothetical protein